MSEQEQKSAALEPQTVQATMLMPLWGRAEGSRICPEILSDSVAQRLVEQVDFDFSDVASGYGEYGCVCCAIRSRKCDDYLISYLNDHPSATVVNIGSGLDTTFERVDNGTLRFYNLDLPDAAAYRLALIPDSERCTTIAKSWFDYSWMDDIAFDPENGIAFIAAGFLYYLQDSDIRRSVAAMARRFTDGRLFYDGCSRLGMRIANNTVRKSGNTGAQMHYFVSSQRDIKGWSEHIDSVRVMPYFSGIKRQKNWEAKTKFSMFFGDALEMTHFVEIRFCQNPGA
jgi:O-methyltransferase involved in polyketide biosynthesis